MDGDSVHSKWTGSRILTAVTGIAVVVAAYVAPLPATAAADRAAYRDQVASACRGLRRIEVAGDATLRRSTKEKVDTVLVLDVIRLQSAQHDATLTALWAEDPPPSLRDDRDEAIERSDEASDLLFDVLTHAEETMPRWATPADLDRAFGYREREADTIDAEAERALSDLAGEDCMKR